MDKQSYEKFLLTKPSKLTSLKTGVLASSRLLRLAKREEKWFEMAMADTLSRLMYWRELRTLRFSLLKS